MSGPDAFGFLQGQFTNDLRAVAAGPVYGLWLNQKGRVLADSFVTAGGLEEFWVGSYFSRGLVIRERLEAYIVADDVAVEDLTGEWSGLTVFGAGSRVHLPGAAAKGVVLPGRRSAEPCFETAFPSSEAGVMELRLDGLTELTPAEVERRRIRARIPAVPTDIGAGDLPNEGGLEVSAISHTKGCYLGQEVIARLRSMGQVRRRLFGVRGGGALPPLPAPLFQGGRKLGEMRSGAAESGHFIGLALLALLNLRQDAPLSFTPDAPGDAIWIEPT